MKERLVNQTLEGMQGFDRQQRLAGKQTIDEQARRQVRTFLDELKNGTQNYRTVASLGGQVAQEYRGRAILELLQNAHDVLAFADDDDPRQISFVLRSSPEPELLVANSGRPFLHADFRGICQLAQSPKDPNESVGNKGLGFQSVLELSTRPEVWSTAPAGEDTAFTFGFDPGVRVPIGRVARALVNGDPPTDPEFGTEHVVDWSPNQIDEYRGRLRQDCIDPVEEVNTYLSPYVVPRFLDDPPTEVAKLLEEGHVTVIRLPLDGGKTGSWDEAIASVREQLRALDEAAMVFLHHLSVLRLRIDEEHTELKREDNSKFSHPEPATRNERLRVSRSATEARDVTERSFHVWSRTIGGHDQPTERARIADAVRHLPNRWPEVRKIEVAVAVEETRQARTGVFVIFLPTRMRTGVGAHINAPFYGSLDRRQINFDDKYNELLFEFVTDLMLDAVVELVKGRPEPWRGRAAIDLVARATDSHAFDDARPLTDRLRQRAHEQGRPLDDLALILCDDGWRLPRVARMMPAIPDDDPIGGAMWRSQVGFTVASSALDERHYAVEALLRSLDGSASPENHEWAHSLQRMAEHLSQSQEGTIWNDFLSSVVAVLPQELRSEPKEPDTDPLREARFLPSDDGRLLAASDAVQIFFRPRRGADDAADFLGSIPATLKPRIAFLHPVVKTHEGTQHRNTEVQKFLDGRFVQRFRREDLLRDVVIPSLPDLPTPLGSSEAAACADTLRWTLNMIGREVPESLLRLFSCLPVACVGGWFAIAEAVFGSGWDGRGGDHLKRLADALPDEEGNTLLRTALLPPDDPHWDSDVANRGDLFAHAGVAEGFRLDTHEASRFWMRGSHLELPEEGPATIRQSMWDDWRDAVRGEIDLGYVSWFEYELANARLLPVEGLLRRKDIEDPARQALAELILVSFAHWEEGWEEATIKKRKGTPWSQRITSPLQYLLSTVPWLDDGHDGGLMPLRQRWLVPESLLRGQKGRFRHLAPLSLPLARRLADDERLLQALEKLGLNVYPTEDIQTGPGLLEALAVVAAARDGIAAGRFDVFLGQVRHAWRHLNPEGALPEHFVVRTRPRMFEVRTAPELNDVYLPDHIARTRSLREHEAPILAMRPAEANGSIGARLHEIGVRRASGLEERCLIDGRRDSATEGAQALEATTLRWLPIVLLALAAHGGANPRGPATDAWQEAAGRLRRVRVRYCHSIAVELVDAKRLVARSEPRAHWLSQDGVLLLNWDVGWSGTYEGIAAASQAILDRQDLLKDLRLVLGSLEGVLEPTRVQIDAALARAEIDPEIVEDIRLRWGGTSLLLDRIRPVAKLLGFSDDGLDDASTDIGRLTDWLADKIPQWPSEELLMAARESYDDFAMGFRAWRSHLGDAAELPRWNDALRALGGDYGPVENDRVQDEAKRHLEEAARSLRAFARHVAIDAPTLHGMGDQARIFSKISEVHERIELDAEWFSLCVEWSRHWWELPFGAVIGALCARYEQIAEVGPYLHVFAGAGTIEEFNSALDRQGVARESDPLEVARENWHRLNLVVRSMWRLYQAWLAREKAESVEPQEAPDIHLDAPMYLAEWSDDDLFARARHAIDNQQFVDACTGCKTIEEMHETLGIPLSSGSTDDPHAGKKAREQRTFLVAGKPFEVDGPETYGELYRRLKDLPEPIGPRAHFDDAAWLTEGPLRASSTTSRPASKTNQTGPKTAQRYASPHLPELVGIVGEMHAFRFLQSRFKKTDEHSWVSEFRTKVLPLRPREVDQTSDSLGYDFRFTYAGKTWCVEVKSTTDHGTSFDLSSGQIATASRIAVRKDERWRILRVRKALSKRPECDWLANPFESGAGQRLRLRQGSMTVRYTLSKNRRNDA